MGRDVVGLLIGGHGGGAQRGRADLGKGRIIAAQASVGRSRS